MTAAALTGALAMWLAAGELFSNGLGPIDSGSARPPSAGTCAACHADAHADWAASRHGRAWTNPIFQREYRDNRLTWCVHCHAPLREQLAEVKQGGGPFADEGVTCAVCHLRGGRMIARRRSPRSPHDTETRADYGGPAFCAGCHQFNFPIIEPSPGGGPGEVTGYTSHPMQDTVAQHARGPLAHRACGDCHRAGAAGHLFPGGHDSTMLARAVTLATCREGDLLKVSLTNVGAGHNVPTGDLHRHLVLRAWRATAPERLQEVVLGRRFQVDPNGGKKTTADKTLRPGETRVLRLPVRALGGGRHAAISLELRLVYTIDEFPFRGRELSEPTWATMLTRDVVVSRLPSCSR